MTAGLQGQEWQGNKQPGLWMHIEVRAFVSQRCRDRGSSCRHCWLEAGAVTTATTTAAAAATATAAVAASVSTAAASLTLPV